MAATTMQDPGVWAGESATSTARPSPFQVVTVTSNKGGVGKTTIAANLAVYVRALREELPILYVNLDDQRMPERMFGLEPEGAEATVADALRAGDLRPAARLGQYGIHYVPTSREISDLKREIVDPLYLQRVLVRTGWRGLVILDTKSDFEILTRNAIAASDLVIVAVSDEAALYEARRVYDLLERWGQPRERARVLLSLIDRRIRYRDGDDSDMLSLLVSRIRNEDYPLFETFFSRSPKVESLYTNPEGRALSILHGAKDSAAHGQMRHLADDVMKALSEAPPACWPTRAAVTLTPLTDAAARALPRAPVTIERFPFRIGRCDAGMRNDLGLEDTVPYQISREHLLFVERDGRIGVVDAGSRLGTRVDGSRVGLATAENGLTFLADGEGTLVLGTSRSPFRFRYRIEHQPVAPADEAREHRPVAGLSGSVAPR